MEYRRLGSTGMYVSEITYGNWITHGSQVEEQAAHKCVRAALDLGITTLDTADVYAGTRAESVMGKALKGVKRESYELFTKVYWPTGTGKNDRGLSRKHIMESCNASLKRLKTDYVDLYQAHRFDYETPLEETLGAFDDLIRSGKVLYIGFSEWNAEQIAAALKIQDQKGYYRFISSQPQYSMLWRVIESQVVPLSDKEGIGQIVWSPIAQGVLTGKYRSGLPSDSRGASPHFSSFIEPYLDERSRKIVEAVMVASDGLGLSPLEVSLAWVRDCPGVTSAVIGARTGAQLRGALSAESVTLPIPVREALDEISAN